MIASNENTPDDHEPAPIRFRSLVVPATREILKGDLKELFEYWSELRGSRFAPSLSKLDWARVPHRLLPQIAVVEVRRNPFDFVYTHWGVGRAIMQGRDYTGKSVREFEPEGIAEKAIREYSEVVKHRMPICVQTEQLEKDGTAPFDYQFLRLPFSSRGVDVDQIIGVGLYDESVMKRAMEFYGTNPSTKVDLDRLIRLLDPDAKKSG
ncbi:MAG: PAS domain-containing protein [Rhodospirillales bacterium]|nr:PAS domain-containing protein [Rhodospirillales bacterium]MBO6787315.1 PAS domain-containing protein [Rhodospirillales bacterium]